MIGEDSLLERVTAAAEERKLSHNSLLAYRRTWLRIIAWAAAEGLVLETLPSERVGEFYEEATRGRSERIDAAFPDDGKSQLHLIIDNYSTHKTSRVRRWLLRHPRFHLHFTPTGSSWLNMVERFFARITTETIRRGSFSSVRKLQAAIDAYLAEHNKEPKPFTWTASADSIFRKLENSLS